MSLIKKIFKTISNISIMGSGSQPAPIIIEDDLEQASSSPSAVSSTTNVPRARTYASHAIRPRAVAVGTGDNDDLYEVEAIIARRKVALKDEYRYKIKWAGFNVAEWVDEDVLIYGCFDLLSNFTQQHPVTPVKRKKKKTVPEVDIMAPSNTRGQPTTKNVAKHDIRFDRFDQLLDLLFEQSSSITSVPVPVIIPDTTMFGVQYQQLPLMITITNTSIIPESVTALTRALVLIPLAKEFIHDKQRMCASLADYLIFVDYVIMAVKIKLPDNDNDEFRGILRVAKKNFYAIRRGLKRKP
jgi:hypothetical protein